MIRPNLLACVALSSLALLVVSPAAYGQRDPVPPDPRKPVTIDNGVIRLTVNPSVGRVVDFGRVGGPNLLRITDASVLTDVKADIGGYQAYGGDVLWPAQQAQWPAIRGGGGTWPPLNELDGPNWTVANPAEDLSATHITITSPASPLLSLVAKRTFEIKPNSTEVVITNTFERQAWSDSNAPIPMIIWSVTGVREPEYSLMGVSPDRPNAPSTYVPLNNTNPSSLVTNLEDALRFDNRGHGPGQTPSVNEMKLGTYGDWIAAVYATDIFLQRSEYDPNGVFPDQAAMEIYSNQGTNNEHIELEILSPGVVLKQGEKLTNVVYWDLVERPTGISDTELANFLGAYGSIPEPASLLLLGYGGFALWLRRRR